VQSPAALRSLLASLAEPPPWDVQLDAGDPAVGLLLSEGFETYAETVLAARRLEGMKVAPHVSGIEIVPYRNAWAEGFAEAEALAMTDDPFYREMAPDTGFAAAEGYGAFFVARAADRIVAFAQAAVPEGWINWMGVVPDERRRGIAREVLGEVAREVAAGRGTHLTCETAPGSDGHRFLVAQGFRDHGRQVYLIRRV